MKIEYITKNSAQTKKIGEILAREILRGKLIKKVYPIGSRRKRDSCGAFVLGLEGDLGGGKTTFLQGFAKGLGIKERILSPTFVILKRYKIRNTRYEIQNFYQIDCYRILKTKEILNLGLEGILSNPQNIVAIEWAEKIKTLLPRETIWLKFRFVNDNKRRILISQIKKQ